MDVDAPAATIAVLGDEAERISLEESLSVVKRDLSSQPSNWINDSPARYTYDEVKELVRGGSSLGESLYAIDPATKELSIRGDVLAYVVPWLSPSSIVWPLAPDSYDDPSPDAWKAYFDSWAGLSPPPLLRQPWKDLASDAQSLFWILAHRSLSDRVFRPSKTISQSLQLATWREQHAHYVRRETTVFAMDHIGVKSHDEPDAKYGIASIEMGQQDGPLGDETLQIELWLGREGTRARKFGIVPRSLDGHERLAKLARETRMQGGDLSFRVSFSSEVSHSSAKSPFDAARCRSSASLKIGLSPDKSRIEATEQEETCKEGSAPDKSDVQVVLKKTSDSFKEAIDRVETAVARDLDSSVLFAAAANLARIIRADPNALSIGIRVSDRIVSLNVFPRIVLYVGATVFVPSGARAESSVNQKGWRFFQQSLLKSLVQRRIYAPITVRDRSSASSERHSVAVDLRGGPRPFPYALLPTKYLCVKLVLDDRSSFETVSSVKITDGACGMIDACREGRAKFELHWVSPKLDSSLSRVIARLDRDAPPERGTFESTSKYEHALGDLSNLGHDRLKNMAYDADSIEHERTLLSPPNQIPNREVDENGTTLAQLHDRLGYPEDGSESVASVRLILHIGNVWAAVDRGMWKPDWCSALMVDPHDVVRQAWKIEHLIVSVYVRPDLSPQTNGFRGRFAFRVARNTARDTAALIRLRNCEVLSDQIYPSIVVHRFRPDRNAPDGSIPIHPDVRSRISAADPFPHSPGTVNSIY